MAPHSRKPDAAGLGRRIWGHVRSRASDAPEEFTPHTRDEVTGWLWATPDRALHDPDITLVYATRSVLETIATGESSTELFKRARSQREVPIVEPRMIETESGWVVQR